MEIKVPFYNVLNMFLTGFVFVGCTMLQYSEKIIKFVNSETFAHLTSVSEMVLILIIIAIAYEIGLILNRLGSVILEPLLKKTRLIPFDNRYRIFQEKAQKFPIMNTLSREYALSRTGIGEFVILAISSGIRGKYELLWIFICIAIIYLLSCRKHASKIVSLMKD